MKQLGNQYGFTISRIYYLFRDLSMKTLSISWFHFEFTIYFEILFLTNYLFRDIS